MDPGPFKTGQDPGVHQGSIQGLITAHAIAGFNREGIEFVESVGKWWRCKTRIRDSIKKFSQVMRSSKRDTLMSQDCLEAFFRCLLSVKSKHRVMHIGIVNQFFPDA